MLQYQIHNKVKRSGRYEMVLMTKYILEEKELAGIDRFLGNMDDLTADNIRRAIKRTKGPYERNYKQDPVVDMECLSFILFNTDAIWLQENCLDKLFTYS